MHSIITSYLLQTGKCALPYLGFFSTEYKPAETDIVYKQILPPLEEIVFNEETILLSPGLVNYIASKKNIAQSEAENQLEKFCTYWKEKIEGGEKLCFDSFGCLQKNELGNIYFTRAGNLAFLKAVPAERVLRQNTQDPVLADNEGNTSPVVNEYYKKDVVVARSGWIIYALILAAISLVGLFFNFYNHKSSSIIGNQNKFTIKATEKTYIELEK
jgi:nucleoid DNA-binding protein